MSTQRERVAIYRDAVKAAGAIEVRLAMTTQDATLLCAELATSELRFPDVCAAGIDALVKAGETKPAEGDSEGAMRYFEQLSKASVAFWDGFEGQVVDGVEIIRRRA